MCSSNDQDDEGKITNKITQDTNKNSKREKSRYEEKSCEVIWIIFEKISFFLSFFALIKLFNSYEFLIHIVWIDNLINKMSIKYKFRIIVTEKLELQDISVI